MAGIRVVHETARYPQMVTVGDPTRPTPGASVCPSCRVKHPTKTYHIAVNDVGAAIVSPGVLEGMRRGGMGGFSVDAEVANPPTQVLGARNGKFRQIQRRDQITIYHR